MSVNEATYVAVFTDDNKSFTTAIGGTLQHAEARLADKLSMAYGTVVLPFHDPNLRITLRTDGGVAIGELVTLLDTYRLPVSRDDERAVVVIDASGPEEFTATSREDVERQIITWIEADAVKHACELPDDWKNLSTDRKFEEYFEMGDYGVDLHWL